MNTYKNAHKPCYLRIFMHKCTYNTISTYIRAQIQCFFIQIDCDMMKIMKNKQIINNNLTIYDTNAGILSCYVSF